MTEILNLASHFIQGKTIYSPVRRLLNLLFNMSITSFIYVNLYGEYELINYNDYKAIFNFLFKGHFFIPFSIYVVVYAITQFSGTTLFFILTHFRSVIYQRKILKFKLDKAEIDENLQVISTFSKYLSPIELDPEKMVDFYKEFRSEINVNALKELENSISEPKKNLEANFIFTFRMLIAVSFYFFSIPEFGIGIYLTITIISILIMLFFVIGHMFLGIIPITIKKLYLEAEQYLLANENNNLG